MKDTKLMTDFEKSVYDKSKGLVKFIEYFHSTNQFESYYTLCRLQKEIKKALKVDNYIKAFELENEFESNTETPIEKLW